VPIYLHHNHEPQDHYAEYHGMAMAGEQAGHGMMAMGPRPPSAQGALFGKAPHGDSQQQPQTQEKPTGDHGKH
jgi:hypothetical protein